MVFKITSKSHYWLKCYGNFSEKSEFFLLDKVVKGSLRKEKKIEFFQFDKVVKLVSGGSVINGANPA